MIDVRFWSVIGVMLLALSLATAARPLTDSFIKRPLSRVVLDFVRDRVRTGWMVLFTFWAAVVLHEVVSVIVFAFVSFFALREFLTRTPANAGDYRALFVSFFIVIPVQYLLVGLGWYWLFSVFIPVYCFLLLPSVTALAGDTREFLARAAKLQWGLMLGVYCISHTPALLTIKEADYDDLPAYMMLVCVLIVQVADIVQYAVSRNVGRRRVARNITRNFTWEGMAAGTAAGVAMALIMYWFLPFNLITTIGIAAATALMGFMGALVLAAVKRSAGFRDWNEGIDRSSTLDRLDSLCFAAPVFYHLTRFWIT
jgi:phosphatidate cytidylyltransferase